MKSSKQIALENNQIELIDLNDSIAGNVDWQMELKKELLKFIKRRGELINGIKELGNEIAEIELEEKFSDD